jgi:hypothetical protein
LSVSAVEEAEGVKEEEEGTRVAEVVTVVVAVEPVIKLRSHA